MQTAGAVAAHVRPFPHCGVKAAFFAQIAGLDHPDSAEVHFEETNYGFGDALEFLVKGRRRQKRLLKEADTFQPQ